MLSSVLVAALNRSDNPRVIKALSKTLEKVTGVTERQILQGLARKEVFPVSEALRKDSAIFPAFYAGSYSNYTGQSVTADSALEVAAVYAVVKILGEDMGALPCFFYRRSADGRSVEQARNDPRFSLLHDLANPDTTASEFVEALTANAALMSDGYGLIERNNSGVPIWMYPISPTLVRYETNEFGQLRYFVRDGSNAPERVYDRSRIFHLRGFSFTGIGGDSLLMRARHVIGIGSAEQEYAGRFFSQDASAGIILKSPLGAPVLGPDAIANLKRGWKEWHQGLRKSHEPAFLQQGIEVQRIDPDLEKLQLIKAREFQVREIARLMRMPLHKLGDLDRAIQSNITQQAIEYVSNTLSPWVRRWKDAIFRCLLNRQEQIEGLLFGEHNVEAYMRGDFEMQSRAFSQFLEKGVFSVNEVRRKLNLNPVPGGDARFIQLNMQNLVDAANGRSVAEGAKLFPLNESEGSNND